MRTLLRVATVLMVAAAAAGCYARGEVMSSLDRTFHLKPGNQAVFPRERLEIGFTRVVNDSRCPEGATCVWAGEAVVAMWTGVEGGGNRESFEARLPASTHPDSATVVDRGDYRVRLLALDPRPKAGVATDSTAYVLSLSVSRR